jgi:hypothetical protein
MEDKRYPKSLFDEDCEKLRNMELDHDVRIEKGNALAHIYMNQNNKEYVDPFAIADQRAEILRTE